MACFDKLKSNAGQGEKDDDFSKVINKKDKLKQSLQSFLVVRALNEPDNTRSQQVEIEQRCLEIMIFFQ